MKCPSCGSTDLQKKGSRNGKQKFRCKECYASFTEGVPYLRRGKLAPLTDFECPSCGSTRVVRDGKLEDGAQRYKCRSCNCGFSTKTSGVISPEDKVSIVQKVLAGKNIEKLKSEYKCTSEFIKDLVKPHYASETITPEQKKDIIKYGYYLRVPVDYMAEYIKCSEHKCEEVLKKFRKTLMSTNHDAI